jgi:signal transduction histidine kinase
MEQQKEFITNASHELKTPLTVISTNMELLNMENPDNPWVRSTQKQTSALRRLVDELVYLSRMEEEHPPLTMEVLSLDALLRETAEPFVDMAEFAGKRLTVDAARETPVTGDRASIQRAISTLLDNAVKFAKPGTCLVVKLYKDSEKAYVSIRDYGETIPQDDLPFIFDRFHKSDRSRSLDKEGVGLGLYLVKAIINAHDEDIAVRSEDGMTEFVFTLTLANEKQKRDQA